MIPYRLARSTIVSIRAQYTGLGVDTSWPFVNGVIPSNVLASARPNVYGPQIRLTHAALKPWPARSAKKYSMSAVDSAADMHCGESPFIIHGLPSWSRR